MLCVRSCRLDPRGPAGRDQGAPAPLHGARRLPPRLSRVRLDLADPFVRILNGRLTTRGASQVPVRARARPEGLAALAQQRLCVSLPSYPILSLTLEADPSFHAPAALALIKLGRSLRPLARLSQWRASCPSSEPIVRLFAPALPAVGAHDRAGEPPPSGTRNHHRWERLCLVELAGRAAAAATSTAARTPCGDCGRTHVECFLLPRASVADGGWDELGWSVRETVERWARWCDDLG